MINYLVMARTPLNWICCCTTTTVQDKSKVWRKFATSSASRLQQNQSRTASPQQIEVVEFEFMNVL